jgi:hypothetical protein
VFAPFQGGGFLTAHHGLFFVYFLQLLFSLLNNSLFAPCIIQALKNPVSPLTLYLLHSSKNPVSLLTIYPGSYCTFCQSKPGLGWECRDLCLSATPPPNDRHLCLLPTCQKCWPDTLATFCYVGPFFADKVVSGETVADTVSHKDVGISTRNSRGIVGK